MIVYEVTLDAEPTNAESLERYMRETHIPQILATGCFSSIRFERAGASRFRARYQAASRADLDRYLADYTTHYREDFAAHFPSGVRASRDEWEELEAWGR